MAERVVISGTGLYAPEHQISNEELVNSFNAYVDNFNQDNKAKIETGEITALEYSSASFIEKASGIKTRFVIEKEGILDPTRMRPRIKERSDDDISIQAEMACKAIHQALDYAQKTPKEIDGIIVSCANLQRSYPGIAMEIQHAMGMQGYGYDMNVACSAATFAIANAYHAVSSKQNRCMVVVNPEITSGHVNFADRDSHFIFGDICTALVIENTSNVKRPGFEIINSKLLTSFSNNIRNNSGFLNHAEMPGNEPPPRYCFRQNGRKVFKEVIPLVQEHILAHLAELKIDPQSVKRYWLHQANINMNELIIKKILGRDATLEESPIILHKYANTASCGSIVAFHLHNQDLQSGDIGLICSFGAGYSIGSIVVQKQ